MYVKLLNLLQSAAATGAQAATYDHDSRLIADMGLDGPAAAAGTPATAKPATRTQSPAVPGIADTALTYAPVFRLAL